MGLGVGVGATGNTPYRFLRCGWQRVRAKFKSCTILALIALGCICISVILVAAGMDPEVDRGEFLGVTSRNGGVVDGSVVDGGKTGVVVSGGGISAASIGSVNELTVGGGTGGGMGPGASVASVDVGAGLGGMGAGVRGMGVDMGAGVRGVGVDMGAGARGMGVGMNAGVGVGVCVDVDVDGGVVGEMQVDDVEGTLTGIIVCEVNIVESGGNLGLTIQIPFSTECATTKGFDVIVSSTRFATGICGIVAGCGSISGEGSSVGFT